MMMMTIIICMTLCAHYAHYVYTTCTTDGRNSSSVGLLPPIHPDRQIDGLGAVNIKKKGIYYIVLIINSEHILCVSSSVVAATVKKKTNPLSLHIIRRRLQQNDIQSRSKLCPEAQYVYRVLQKHYCSKYNQT